MGGSVNDSACYPFRLTPVNRVTESIREVAQSLMIDSSINDPTMTNEKVLDKAIEFDADYVVPKDYWENIDETHKSVQKFVDMHEERDCEATIVFPLQPPHERHYTRYEDFYSDKSYFALGGMKGATPETQIEAAKNTREAIGPSPHLHGLGMGCSEALIDAIWNADNLLDSMDTSTFERLPGFGKIAGATWEQIGSNEGFEMPNGEYVSSLNGIATEFMVYLANYQLTSLVDRETPGPELTADAQMTLGDSWETSQNPVETDDGDVDPAEETDTLQRQ